jgi:hypothetical protein
MVAHTFRYCRDVAREPGKVDVVGAQFPTATDEPLRVDLMHIDFPGWAFTLERRAGATSWGRFTMLEWSSYPPDLQRLRPTAKRPHRPLGARLLRAVPIVELQATADAFLRERASREAETALDVHGAALWRRMRENTLARLDARPGRRGRADIEYAEYAAEYAVLVADGAIHPVATLAERRNYSRQTVSNALYEARRRGLLTEPPVRGRAGGQLTAKALGLLREAHE